MGKLMFSEKLSFFLKKRLSKLAKYFGFIEYKNVEKCPLCEECEFRQEKKLEVEGLPVNLVSCNNCNFVFQTPRMDKASNDWYYNSLYRLNTFRFQNGLESSFQRQQKRGNSFVGFLDSISQYKAVSKVMEIGCGYGGILQVFRENGKKVVGFDFDTKAIAFGKRFHGLDLSHESPFAITSKQDLLILSHVLEHVEEPKDFLNKCQEVLSLKGVLLLEVPHYSIDNLRCVQPGHLSYFTLRTLSQLIEKNFSIIKTEENHKHIRIACVPKAI